MFHSIATKSSIETILRLNFLATFISSGSLAIDPSSVIISQITPAGENPANLAKSIGRPQYVLFFLEHLRLFAIKGKICPGLAKSSGFVCLLTKACIVFDLSEADIPDVTPFPFKSTKL